jgi:hypothetical protein
MKMQKCGYTQVIFFPDKTDTALSMDLFYAQYIRDTEALGLVGDGLSAW